MIKFMGDIHGNYGIIRQYASYTELNISAIIQVGDFGFYPQSIDFWSSALPFPVYWIDGNHEHFGMLAPYMNADGPVEIKPGLFYVPRGTVMDIGGYKMGFMGGAASIDRYYRQAGRDWFPEEIVKGSDIDKLMAYDGELDYLVTHTPGQVMVDKHFDRGILEDFGLPITWKDPSQAWIDVLKNKFASAQIICGHMHRSIYDESERTRILDINQSYDIMEKV